MPRPDRTKEHEIMERDREPPAATKSNVRKRMLRIARQLVQPRDTGAWPRFGTRWPLGGVKAKTVAKFAKSVHERSSVGTQKPILPADAHGPRELLTPPT